MDLCWPEPCGHRTPPGASINSSFFILLSMPARGPSSSVLPFTSLYPFLLHVIIPYFLCLSRTSSKNPLEHTRLRSLLSPSLRTSVLWILPWLFSIVCVMRFSSPYLLYLVHTRATNALGTNHLGTASLKTLVWTMQSVTNTLGNDSVAAWFWKWFREASNDAGHAPVFYLFWLLA